MFLKNKICDGTWFLIPHNQRHWIQVQKLPVVHILQHLRPLSWVLRTGYHSELTLGNVIVIISEWYHFIIQLGSITFSGQYLMCTASTAFMKSLWISNAFSSAQNSWQNYVFIKEARKGDLELLRDWQGELEERCPSDASLCRFRPQSEQKEGEWYSSGRTCCDNQVNVIHPPVWGDNFCIGRFPP